MMEKYQCIKKIASKARKNIELNCVNASSFNFDYDLAGACALASCYLFKCLEKNGIKSEIHMAVKSEDIWAHVFLVVENMIVDITATQFDRKRRVVICPIKTNDKQRFWYWKTDYVFKNVHDLIALQRKNGWHPNQIFSAKTEKFFNFI